MPDIQIIFWAVALVVLLIVEGVTAQLVTIWFAAGSLAALIAAILKAPVLAQIVLFVVVSAVSLIATRPIVKKITSKKAESFNADKNIGKMAVVTEDIDNLNGTGAAKLDGLVWTARSSDGSKIEAGKSVIVEKIEGVKIIVKES